MMTPEEEKELEKILENILWLEEDNTKLYRRP